MALTLDPAVEQRFQQELEAGGYRSPSDLVAHLLDVAHAGEDWLLQNKEAINAALDESFAAKARGESYSAEESRALLDEHRAARKNRAARSFAFLHRPTMTCVI